MQSTVTQQEYLEVWFASALPELTEIQKPIKEYFLKYADPEDFGLEVEVGDDGYSAHATFYGTKWLTKNCKTVFCARTESWVEPNDSFASLADMEKLDKLFQTADLAARDEDLVHQLTGFISIHALFHDCGHTLLYSKRYRPFLSIICDWNKL